MRYRLSCLTALLALPAMQANAQVKYQPDGFMRHGYSARGVGADVWEVKGSSGEHDGGVAVALYRAAELAAEAQADRIRIVRQKVRVVQMMRRGTYSEIGYRETAAITVHAVRTDADGRACEMPDRSTCMTLSVAGIMARYGPTLGRAAALPGSEPATPVTIVSSPFSPAEIARFNERQAASAAVARYYASRRGEAAPAPVAVRPAVVAPTPRASAAPPVATTPTAGIVLQQRLRAAEPVHGREPTLGWSVSD